MNATKRLTPKRQRIGYRLYHALGHNPLAPLMLRAGAVWLLFTHDDKWIVRARSDRGEEWAAR